METLVDHHQQPNAQNRKPYQKPQVEIVNLMPEQTVLGGICYTSFSSGEFAGCSPEIQCML